MDMYQAALVAVLVFTVPGFLTCRVSGVRAPWAAAASIPASFGIYGLAAWFYGLTPYAYDARSVSVFSVVVLLIAGCWRLGALAVTRRFRGRAADDGVPEDGDNGAGAPGTMDNQTAQEEDSGTEPKQEQAPPVASVALSVLENTTAHSEAETVASTMPGDGAEPQTATGPDGAIRRRTPLEIPAEPGAGNADEARDRLRQREERWLVGSMFDPVWVLPATGVLVAFVLLLSRSLTLLRDTRYGLENIFQGWDVHWHASVVRFIQETGVASPTRMGELQNIESREVLFYPTAWHSGAAIVRELTGTSSIAAINLTSIVLPALLLPLAASVLAWRLVGNRGLTAQIAAGFAAVIVVPLPVLYWIGYYVGAWPYLAAIGMAFIVLALFMSVPAAPVRAFAAALVFVGMVETHPSAATIVVLVLGLWWLLDLVWRPTHRSTNLRERICSRIRDFLLLAATGLAATLVLLPQILTGLGQSEEVKSFVAYEDLTRSESWWAAIQMQTRHTDAFGINEPLLWAAAVGGVILVVWRRNIWAPLFWFISVVVTVNSLLPFTETWWSGLATQIGSLHYNTAHRLVMPVAMFTAAAAAVALAAVGRLVLMGPIRRAARFSVPLSVVAALVGGVFLVQEADDEMQFVSDFAIGAARDGRMVDSTDLKAYRWLAKQPLAYEGTIMSNPADGSGWMYPYNGLPNVFRHYLWPTVPVTSATNRMFWNPNQLGTGNFDDPNMENEVDKAAQRLNVHYIYVSPPNFWAFQEPVPEMEVELWNTPGVTPVYKDRQVSIYAVNEWFTDSELDRMRRPGNSPEPLPPLPTRAEAGVAPVDSGDGLRPYHHRPSRLLRGPVEHFESDLEKARREAADAAESVQ
ncbi:hypothetical protein M0E87_01195 [Corynebacterium sp. CCM 9185]|uniref:Uncharacterized protein n=1 Tax=Corynebacterium marambiense TaxID=2765364 RepID=A0ABS0VV10_9CORY|nr:DUF6541 family protein [Corynebacterium marambiense]MBI8999450.1 hypothetical protein [Corynebacterium marambiense]MCK7662288.1 hypothetical protein [Corynebacterium marambiense]